jgi:hypothetical protein
MWIAGQTGAYTAKDHHFRPGQMIEKQIVLINDTRQPQSYTVAWSATVGGQELDKGQSRGNLDISEVRCLPFQVIAPATEAGGKTDGQFRLAQALGWRVCPKVARRVFPVPSAIRHSSFANSAGPDDLRDWTGSSTLIDAYPEYVGNCLRGNERDQPYAGWHWGNRGGVTSAAIEKPHRSGWRPLLECEFDLGCTPLMELDHGRGRLFFCTLDLGDHVAQDPAARRIARHVIDYALHSPASPPVGKVVYLGNATGAAWLDTIGVSYQQSATLDTGAGLLLIGPVAGDQSGEDLDPAALTVLSVAEFPVQC